MVIDKLSDAAKAELFDKLNIASLDTDSLDTYNSLEVLARIATELDRGGFYESASEIDELIKQKINKLKDPGRLKAKAIRAKHLNK